MLNPTPLVKLSTDLALFSLQLVHSQAQRDLACCMMWAPHLLANSIHAPQKLWPGLGGVPDATRFLCSHDLAIAAACCRGCASVLAEGQMPRTA
jgi:hypothetical protein